MKFSVMEVFLQISWLLVCIHVGSSDYQFIDGISESNALPEDLQSRVDKELLGVDDTYINNVDPYHHGPEKRGVAKLLMGIAIGAALVNIGTDVFLGNGGCCIINKAKYSNACEKVPIIKGYGKELATIGTKLDYVYYQSQLDMSWLDNINSQNRMISVEMANIRNFQRQIIETMDPQLINEFKAKAQYIKDTYKKTKAGLAKVSVGKVIEVYKPLYKSWNGRLALFGAVGLNIFGDLANMAAERMFERKVAREIKTKLSGEIEIQFNKQLEGLSGNALKNKKARLLKLTGGDSIDQLVSRSAKAQAKQRVATSSMTKNAKRFGTFMSVAGIGMELYDLFNKIKKCFDAIKLLNEKEIKLKKAVTDFTGTLNNMTLIKKDITDQYMKIKGTLTDPGFTSLLKEFRSFIALAAPTARKRMERATININLFIKYASVTNPSLTSTLQKYLIEGLQQIKFRYECRLYRVEAIKRTASDCKLGSKDLATLFNRNSGETKLTSCVTQEGVPYATFKQIEQFIKKDSIESKYNPSCLLNSGSRVSLLCRRKCEDDETYADILKGYPSIKESDLKKICEPQPTGQCPFRKLHRRAKNEICNQKKAGNKVQKVIAGINAFSNFDPKEIAKVYTRCPPKKQ